MSGADLKAIRQRDATSGALWFTGPASFTAQAARDRRDLLAAIDSAILTFKGVASCSTCGACRGAAQLKLAEFTDQESEAP